MSSATGLPKAFRELKIQRISHCETLQVSVPLRSWGRRLSSFGSAKAMAWSSSAWTRFLSEAVL